MCAPLALIAGATLAFAQVQAPAWIAVGGGPTADSNQVSIEVDLRLAPQVLTGPGVILFAGGAGHRAVLTQEHPPEAAPEWRETLATLFEPRVDRRAGFAAPEVHANGPATADEIRRVFSQELSRQTTNPITLFLSGHGSSGEEDDRGIIRGTGGFLGWGNSILVPTELAQLLDGAAQNRPVRVVISACYAGHFEDIAHVGADHRAGVTTKTRCGFFASTYDRPASGCDATAPSRGVRGYGYRFLSALRDASADLDGNARVSFLEAHVRAASATNTIDVPTTTSESVLRGLMPRTRAAMLTLSARSQRASTRTVAEWTTLRQSVVGETTLRAAYETFDRVVRDRETALSALERQQTAEESLSFVARAAVENEYPYLMDAWRTDFAPSIARDAAALEHLVRNNEDIRAWRSAHTRTLALSTIADASELELSRSMREIRALENVLLAENASPAVWTKVSRFLECERGLQDSATSAPP